MSKYDYLTYEDLYRAVKQCGSKRAAARFLKIPWSSFCELWDRKVLGKVKGAESGEIHRIGIMSDTHIGSLYDQIDNVRDFVNKCEEMECEIILHSGDICDGIDMRPYHEYEIYLHTLDEIEEGIINSLPEIGIPYYLITGNHDHSIFKKIGTDIGERIAQHRKDFKYLGYSNVDFQIPGGLWARMYHGNGGCGQIRSHRLQKKALSAIEERVNKHLERLSLFVSGHCHSSMVIHNYFGMICISAGCFQRQTPHLKATGLISEQCGFILEYEVLDGMMINPQIQYIGYKDVI